MSVSTASAGPTNCASRSRSTPAHVQRLRASFGRQTVIALGVIGLALSLGDWIQSSFALRPLNADPGTTRRAFTSAAILRMKGQFPREIAPLVDDLNKLLARQEDLVRRARERAGDLAHGLKTPLAIIQIEARNAEQRGDAKTAALLREQVAAMNRHVERELRRARMSGAAAGGGALVDARETVERLIRTVQRMPGGQSIDWLDELPARGAVAHGPGRLRRNRRQPSRQRPQVRQIDRSGLRRLAGRGGRRSASTTTGRASRREDRERILRRGERATDDGEGSGLGLSIVIEALAQYGLTLTIGDSPLGGCRMSFPAFGLRLR